MSSIPNSYIDDLRSIVLATLNRIEQLRMRVLFGVDIIKGSYGQELQFKSDGKVYIDGVEVGIAWNTQSFTNLLENGDVESWSAGAAAAPDGWVYVQDGAGGGVARVADTKINNYVARITKSDSGDSRIIYDLPTYLRYAGRTVTLGVWIKSANTVADQVKIVLYDGVYSDSGCYQNSGDWEFVTITYTVHSPPTHIIRLFLSLLTGADATADYVGAILVEGSVCPAFSPKPLVDDGKSIAINSATNVTTFGGNVNIDGSNLIDADSIIADTATDLTLTVDTGQAFVFSKV